MSVATQNKTFLLGVGAQKGGTTWLYDYLNRHPAANMGFIKEHHVFDKLYIPECVPLPDPVTNRIEYVTRVPRSISPQQKQRWKSFYEDTSSYFDYFQELSQSGSRIQLVGDITPSYSGLSTDAFRMIRSNLIQRGFRVRVIFLMRDPVERLWSAVRMARRKARKRSKTPDLHFKRSESKQVMFAALQPEVQIRARYDKTISALQESFEPEELHFSLYEELFTPEAIQDLTAFLDIAHIEPDFGNILNASPKNDALDDEAQTLVADHYGPSYAAAASLMGAEKLRKLWASFLMYEDRHGV